MPNPPLDTKPTDSVPSSRKPGRSFSDHEKPLGAELVATASPSDEGPHAGVYGRATERRDATESAPRNVADRAKAVSVLRKAEEFMRTANPPPTSPAEVHRALELAAGRIGITYEDYAAIVRADPELGELEQKVILSAKRHA